MNKKTHAIGRQKFVLVSYHFHPIKLLRLLRRYALTRNPSKHSETTLIFLGALRARSTSSLLRLWELVNRFVVRFGVLGVEGVYLTLADIVKVKHDQGKILGGRIKDVEASLEFTRGLAQKRDSVSAVPIFLLDPRLGILTRFAWEKGPALLYFAPDLFRRPEGISSVWNTKGASRSGRLVRQDELLNQVRPDGFDEADMVDTLLAMPVISFLVSKTLNAVTFAGSSMQEGMGNEDELVSRNGPENGVMDSEAGPGSFRNTAGFHESGEGSDEIVGGMALVDYYKQKGPHTVTSGTTANRGEEGDDFQSLFDWFYEDSASPGSDPASGSAGGTDGESGANGDEGDGDTSDTDTSTSTETGGSDEDNGGDGSGEDGGENGSDAGGTTPDDDEDPDSEETMPIPDELSSGGTPPTLAEIAEAVFRARGGGHTDPTDDAEGSIVLSTSLLDEIILSKTGVPLINPGREPARRGTGRRMRLTHEKLIQIVFWRSGGPIKRPVPLGDSHSGCLLFPGLDSF